MGIKEVDFTTHAEEKLKRLMSLGVTKEKVLEIVRNPEKIVYGLWKKNCTRFINWRVNVKDCV
jgi:hypothetical protein